MRGKDKTVNCESYCNIIVGAVVITLVAQVDVQVNDVKVYP